MAAARQITLVLRASLDDGGSIEGSLQGGRLEPRPFAGWLGLAAAVTELADRLGDSPDAEPGTDEPSYGRPS